MLTAGLRFCVGGRVWAVRGRESGQGVGVPGRGRDVGCFGGIVHFGRAVGVKIPIDWS